MSEGPYSFETGVKKTFHTADYAVFGCTLAISAAIGIFYAIKDRKKNTTEEYLLAGRDMHPIPVALSLLSSFISAITILGTPAEVYIYNTMYGWIAVSMIVMAIGAGMIFIPTFYNLGVTSVFEYVEMRFGRVVRIIACIIYLVWMLLYLAIVLYAPSLALNQVTGLSLWGSVIAVGLVCTFYTTLGGMKAVLWADTVQVLIIYGGMLTVLIVGSNTVGGFNKAWDIADQNGRILFWEFDPDPRVRHSVWTLVIGGGIYWCAVFGTNQAMVQRAISVRNVTRSKLVIFLNVPGMASIIILSTIVGVVLYAFYAECDAVKFGLVKKPDQMLPLMMMDLLGDMHGLPGLLLSCIFSGSLSTVSSGLNGISAVLLQDFIRPACCKKMDNVRATLLSKAMVVVGGLFALVMAFAVSKFPTMILQLTYSLFGALGGPLLGLFTLGMLFPWANRVGGGVGLVTGLALMLWICWGTTLTKTSVVIKPAMNYNKCNYNLTEYATAAPPTTLAPSLPTEMLTTTHVYDKYDGIQRLYTMSYMWYTGLGCITVFIVGAIVSLITGRTDPKTLNPKLICPVFDVFFPCLPENVLKTLRFGVRHGEDVTDEMQKESLDKLHMDHTTPYIVEAKNGKAEGKENVAFDPPSYKYNTHL